MLTVGVPVYNAARFLERCLGNLCAEDLDYRIVISDNASTDQTGEIAQAFARADKRIRPLAVGSPAYEDEQGTPPAPQAIPAELPADPAQRRALLLRLTEVTWIYGVFRRAELCRRYAAARRAYDYAWSFDPLVLLPFVLEASVVTEPAVTFTQYVCGGSAARYRPKGVIACSRLVSQFCRHGFAIADEMATSPGQRLRLYADVLRYSNSHGVKFSRIAKRAVLWPYYRLRGRL